MEQRKDIDVLVVGAGPAGLATACSCQDEYLSCLVTDRAGLAQSFSEYPHNLQFFSPPAEMEIGGIPLPVAGGLKPTRETYLAYLRAVARTRQIPLCTWTAITGLEQDERGRYVVHTVRRPTDIPGPSITARFIVLATGVWDEPNRLGVPGETMPHVFNELKEPTPYFGCNVLVVGAGNSAVGGALTLAEAGANVGLAMRRPPKAYRCGLRPFVKRDLDFAVEEEQVKLHDNTVVDEVLADGVRLQPVRYTGTEDLSEGTASDYEAAGSSYEVPAAFVFALIGHRPDQAFFAQTLGLETQEDGRPQCDKQSWETRRRNIFLVGSVADPSIDVVLKLRNQAAEVAAILSDRNAGANPLGC